MSRHWRTLLLLGFTCAAGGLSGCFVETGGNRNNNSSQACLDSQYFNVQWEMDNGTAATPLSPLQCAQAPVSHVELTTTANQILQVGQGCTDGPYYNFLGSSQSGIPAGTVIRTANLISNSTNKPLSTAEIPPSAQVAMPRCARVELTFEFPLTPS